MIEFLMAIVLHTNDPSKCQEFGTWVQNHYQVTAKAHLFEPSSGSCIITLDKANYEKLYNQVQSEVYDNVRPTSRREI